MAMKFNKTCIVIIGLLVIVCLTATAAAQGRGKKMEKADSYLNPTKQCLQRDRGFDEHRSGIW